jgi:transposase
MKKRVVFKPYIQHQTTLLPPSLEELIAPDHLVRTVNSIIDQLDIDPLLLEYKGGGTSSYHPRMMLKVWVFGYMMKVHSCRTLAKALREHIPFMWLAGMQQPDFRTLNDFRTNRMKPVIGDVFKQVVLFCLNKKYIDLSMLFIDGTKYQANANKHKSVWRKKAARYKEGVLDKIDELLLQIDRENEAENKKYGQKDLHETGSHLVTNGDELKKEIKELGERINQGQVDRIKKKELEKAKRHLGKHAEKLAQYETQEITLGDRNSFSKTDPDATMMFSKDNQLLPCYNVQHSCQNQVIVHYSVSQNPNDGTVFMPHLKTIPDELKPQAMLGDSIYGNLFNYQLLQETGIENYLMFPSFHQEQKPKFAQQIFKKENFKYNEQTDTYTCPNQQTLDLVWSGLVTLSNRTMTEEKHYKASTCKTCPFYTQCCKGENNRIIKFRPQYEYFKSQATSNLTSDKGKRQRMQRGVEVETPFADIKHNQGHRRVVLRGKQKVAVEIGLICIAHNMKKISSFMKNAS